MSLSPIRLLVVEDNDADALLLQHTLADAGNQAFDVTHVELMGEAVRILDASRSTPSCWTSRCRTVEGWRRSHKPTRLPPTCRSW